MDFTEIQAMIEHLPGKIGVYYKDLSTGDTFGYNEHESFMAASVIKLPILIAVLNKIRLGQLKKTDLVKVTKEDIVAGCGAIRFMHPGLEVTVSDLCNLMIVLSDNTATNMLIRLVGMDYINQFIEEIGLKTTRLNRLLFDYERAKQGFQNYYSPIEIGNLLEQIYHKKLISEEICYDTLEILKLQQLNSKIPYLIPKGIVIAHKTGEDEGITHDVGIILTKKPFILCFASNKTDVIASEDVLRKLALMFYKNSI